MHEAHILLEANRALGAASQLLQRTGPVKEGAVYFYAGGADVLGGWV